MNADRFATLYPVTLEDAEILLRHIDNMALWKPAMIGELLMCGFDTESIIKYLDNDPMYLLGYLAIQNADNLPPGA